MARNRMTIQQRQELHKILDYVNSPSGSPNEYAVKQAVMCFLMGRDAQAELEKKMPAFTARLMVKRAMVFIGNERGKRRNHAAEILRARAGWQNPKFTFENIRVTMDHSQNKDYGAMNASIYCTVEVFEDEDTVEKEYLINFSDFKTKEWFTRLLVWALTNKREVLVRPAGEEAMSSMKMFVPKDKVPA